MLLSLCFLLNYYTLQEDFRRLMYIYIFVPPPLPQSISSFSIPENMSWLMLQMLLQYSHRQEACSGVVPEGHFTVWQREEQEKTCTALRIVLFFIDAMLGFLCIWLWNPALSHFFSFQCSELNGFVLVLTIFLSINPVCKCKCK